jgi:hypothetical protein
MLRQWSLLKYGAREWLGSDGWDGEGSKAVTPATLAVAEKVARALFVALPLGPPPPDLGPDCDGEISFEWIAEQGRLFSVSVGANVIDRKTNSFENEDEMKAYLLAVAQEVDNRFTMVIRE